MTQDQLDSIYLMQHIRARIMRHWAPADQVGATIYATKEAEAKKPASKYFDEEATRTGKTVTELKASIDAKVVLLATVLQKADYIYEDYKDRIENEVDETQYPIFVDAYEVEMQQIVTDHG